MIYKYLYEYNIIPTPVALYKNGHNTCWIALSIIVSFILFKFYFFLLLNNRKYLFGNRISMCYLFINYLKTIGD